jgi:hypothetical protein
MWNQNNGNGQGNGQPQNQAQGYGQQDVYERLNNAREIRGGVRFPYIEPGMHKLALVILEEFGNANEPKVRAVFKTMESRTQKAGEFCVKIWNLTKPPFKSGMITESEEFADFCRKLKGAPVGHPIGSDIRTLMTDRVRDQLARGTIIEVNGVQNKKGNYVKLYWNHVPQDGATIAAMRQRLELEGVPSTSEGSAVPQQQMQAPQQNTQGGYQPAQNGYQQTQYGQPQQPAPQGPPPGGFLANVPTNNGGNGQGGNQGGSW